MEKIAPKPAKKDKESRKSQNAQQIVNETNRKRHLEWVGDSNRSLPEFPQLSSMLSASVIQFGVDDEEIELFEDAYREHCEQILDYVLGLQFDELKQYWHDFWHIQHYEGKHLAKEKFQTLLTIPGVSSWIYQCDQILYKNLVDVLIPDVLKQVGLFDKIFF